MRATPDSDIYESRLKIMLSLVLSFLGYKMRSHNLSFMILRIKLANIFNVFKIVSGKEYV